MAASTTEHRDDEARETITMPRPTAWPMLLAAGVALVAAGVATSLFVSLLGLAIAAVAIGGWIVQLLPGNGEIEEPRVAPEQRCPRGPAVRPRKVAKDRAGGSRVIACISRRKCIPIRRVRKAGWRVAC